MKVLNYGSLNVDYVYSVDHIIVGGETQHSSKLEVFSGGKGLNQSIALAKAGVPVYHAGIVGSDGDILLDACKEAGVNTKYIRRLPVKGEIVLALVHRSRTRDENIIRSFRPYIKANLWARKKMESSIQIKFSVNRNI